MGSNPSTIVSGDGCDSDGEDGHDDDDDDHRECMRIFLLNRDRLMQNAGVQLLDVSMYKPTSDFHGGNKLETVMKTVAGSKGHDDIREEILNPHFSLLERFMEDSSLKLDYMRNPRFRFVNGHSGEEVPRHQSLNTIFAELVRICQMTSGYTVHQSWNKIRQILVNELTNPTKHVAVVLSKLEKAPRLVAESSILNESQPIQVQQPNVNQNDHLDPPAQLVRTPSRRGS